jgi:signal transduction histidine kinase
LIEIRDTGCGIPEEKLDHIFDPFFTTKEEGEGTGMGLSIVYGVVKNHGGNIRVESQVGKGTSSVLSFPIS